MFNPERAVLKALNLGADYADAIIYEVEQYEQAFRGGSIESNEARSIVYGVRVIVEGRMGIASSTAPNEDRLVRSAIKAASLGMRVRGLAGGRMARGSYKFPEAQSITDNFYEEIPDYIVSFTSEVEERLSEVVKYTEVIVTASKVRRFIVSSEGTNAYEEKPIVDFVASTLVRGSREVSSIAVGGTGGLEVILSYSPKKLANQLARRSSSGVIAKRLNPVYRGFSFPVIFNGKAAAALIHEAVGHPLEADTAIERGRPIRVGVKMASRDLTVIDDPLIPGGYGSYFFDDEGVVARRKTLVEDGVIVNLIHNRWSAHIYGVEPLGNGRGLFYPPKALMSNIKVKPRDWKLQEMIEETRLGFLVNDAVRAELINGFISLIPEDAWLIERGEVKEPVNLREVRLSTFKALNKIDAVGRAVDSRFTVEKGQPIGEYSPPIRISEVHIF